MKRFVSVSLVSVLALSGCSSALSKTVQNEIRNPLFAEQYAEELVDYLVNLEIYSNDVVKDENKKKIIDNEREKWLEVARTARAEQRKGSEADFIGVTSGVLGSALYKENVLYLSPVFSVSPGPGLHIYLTTGVDPRDGFPDEDTIDLGPVQTPYGAQQYAVPAVDNSLHYRTVVLYDKDLELIFAFAQLNVNPENITKN